VFVLERHFARSDLGQPVVDGRVNTATLFDVGADASPRRLAFESVERRAGGMLWLRYRVTADLSE